MQRLFLLVAVMLLSGCLTAPPKEAARPTLMPRAQSYKDLTHLPAPTGKIFVSVYNIQDETGQFKPYPASNFSTPGLVKIHNYQQQHYEITYCWHDLMPANKSYKQHWITRGSVSFYRSCHKELIRLLATRLPAFP